MPRVPLYISRDIDLDWLHAFAFGRVNDGHPDDHYRVVGDQFRYLLDGPNGEPIGFDIAGFREFDAHAREYEEIWRPPRFDAPTLGLMHATAGEIALAARAELLDEPTLNRAYFSLAINAESPDEAVALWRACLECGDQMAHYALGYTLHELGRHREAYRHLRFYAELVPQNAWAWCWLGKACDAMGESVEARQAFQRAIALEEAGGFETDAPQLLTELGDPAEGSR